MNGKTTIRMARLARAIEACSARDLSVVVEQIAGQAGTENAKYWLYRRLLSFAVDHRVADARKAK